MQAEALKQKATGGHLEKATRKFDLVWQRNILIIKVITGTVTCVALDAAALFGQVGQRALC